MTVKHVVVVGAGLAGAATAWQLARRGIEVTVLERDVPASARGSSHGSARIFRYGYADPFFARLLVEAMPEWDALQADANTRLLDPVGCLDVAEPPQQTLLEKALEAAGVAHEIIDVSTAQERWPGIALDRPVMWQPTAAVIDPEETVHAMLSLATTAGATVLTDTIVTAVRETPRGVTVTAKDAASGDDRALAADAVVVAAGGFLPDLLVNDAVPDAARRAIPAIEVREENAFHFPYRDTPDAAAWPTLIDWGRASTPVYALPGGRDADGRGQKVALYNAGASIRSASQQRGVPSDDLRERTTAYVREYLPGLLPEPYAETTCLSTNTPTEDFVIDGTDRVLVVSACSGHGAKFMPLIGRIAADAVLGIARPPARFRLSAS